MSIPVQGSVAFVPTGVGHIPRPTVGARFKRGLDLAGAAFLLAASAPLLLLAALAIKLTSRGPVLLRQRRVGRAGRPFELLKLRTMRAGSDAGGADAPHRAYVRRWIRGEPYAGDIHKIIDDPRVLPVGSLLRRFCIDELPQLVNVLRGEMSLVGPRPALPYEVEHYGPAHLRRLAGLPGLTGPWQVSGRHRLSFEEMVALDLDYLERPSSLRDAGILLRTVPVLLFERGY